MQITTIEDEKMHVDLKKIHVILKLEFVRKYDHFVGSIRIR